MTSATLRPALLAMLRARAGSPDERINHALAVLAEELAMDVAFVSHFRDGQRLITHAASAAGPSSAIIGTSCAEEETLCHLIAHGKTPPLAPDLANDEALSTHPHRTLFDLGAYAGVPLRAGTAVVGAVCCASSTPQTLLNARDESTLRAVSEFISEVLALPAAPVLAQPATEPATEPATALGRLDEIAEAVSTGDSLESLTRPLLEILQQVTNLESTYLTTIDWAAGTQSIAFANNVGDLDIPEGATFGWADTLCRRSLEEGVSCTNEVPALWGDSEAARAMGIVTYVSVAVRDENDGVVGTLCGASGESLAIDPRDLAAMNMFARLLGAELARQKARDADARRSALLEERTRELTELATRDPLTGASNRSGVHAWLEVVLLELRSDLEQLAVAFIDVDHFKSVNDTYGHEVGDTVLRELSASLHAVGRPGDLIGRLGGDEFVVAAVLPASAATFGGWVSRVQRAATVTVDDLRVSASVGAHSTNDRSMSSGEALRIADEAMYVMKRGRAGALTTAAALAPERARR